MKLKKRYCIFACMPASLALITLLAVPQAVSAATDIPVTLCQRGQRKDD
jgi:hypothetical protein